MWHFILCIKNLLFLLKYDEIIISLFFVWWGEVRGCVKWAHDLTSSHIDHMPLNQIKIVSPDFWYRQISYCCPINLFNIVSWWNQRFTPLVSMVRKHTHNAGCNVSIKPSELTWRIAVQHNKTKRPSPAVNVVNIWEDWGSLFYEGPWSNMEPQPSAVEECPLAFTVGTSRIEVSDVYSVHVWWRYGIAGPHAAWNLIILTP